MHGLAQARWFYAASASGRVVLWPLAPLSRKMFQLSPTWQEIPRFLSGNCRQMNADPEISTWESAVTWLRNQPEQRQLILDAFYDDPLISAAERYFRSSEWHAISRLLQDRAGTALDVG